MSTKPSRIDLDPRFRARCFRKTMLEYLASGPAPLHAVVDAFERAYETTIPKTAVWQCVDYLVGKERTVTRVCNGVYVLSAQRDVLAELKVKWPDAYDVLRAMLARHEQVTTRLTIDRLFPPETKPHVVVRALHRLQDARLIRPREIGTLKGYVPTLHCIHLAGLLDPFAD